MPDYPDKAHPPLGICVMILVILNVSYLLLLLLLYWRSRCPIGRGIVHIAHRGHCPDSLWEGELSRFPMGRGIFQIPHGRGIVHMSRSPSEGALQRVKYAK